MNQLSSIRFLARVALVAAPLVVAGCASAPPIEEGATATDTTETTESAAQPLHGGSARARRIARLKQRIREIALANIERTDNFDDVAAELRPLVAALVAIAPARTEAERLDLLAGPWRNLWSNLGYGPFPPDLTRVYQVVTKSGHYYNLSQATFTPPGSPVPVTMVNALRGAYAVVPDGLAIRFTRNGFYGGSLSGLTGAGLVQIAADVESGSRPLSAFPGGASGAGGPSGGQGPIGITGKLTAVYVDDDLRIAGGEQTPVFDDQGVVRVPGQFDILFVLERQVGAVP